MNQQEDRIRTIAGYLLKNNARLILRAPPEVVLYVKASVLQAFFDQSIMVRNAAGQDIVSFMGILEPRNWPECLQQLVNTLDNPALDQQEVSTINPRLKLALLPVTANRSTFLITPSWSPGCFQRTREGL